MSRKTLTFENNPLFGGPSLSERNKSGSPFRLLSLSEIDVDPDQPRRVFEEEALKELTSSVKEYGILTPILVRITSGGTYRLVSGERRLRAARAAGLDTIPAMIDSEDGDESSLLGKQLVENIQRQDLSPMERALAIGQLREQFSLSIRDIAKKLGISKSLVQRSLEILSLPDDLQAALIAGGSESKILVLAQLEDRAERKKLLAKLSSYTRSALQELVERCGADETRGVSHRGTARSSKQTKLSPEDQRLLTEIQNTLGTKVSLVRKGKEGKGKLLIDFYSDEDLSDLYERLTSR